MNKKLINAILKRIPPNRNISPIKTWKIRDINNNEVEIELETITPQNQKKIIVFKTDKKEI